MKAQEMKYYKLRKILEDDILSKCLNIGVKIEIDELPRETLYRLDFLCEVITALEGIYNYFGINRWFRRKRTALGNKSPLDILSGDWRPEDKNPQKVLNLAKRLLAGTIAS